VRSRASSFKWEYPLLSLRSSNSFLRFLPRLLITFFSPFIFPSITCFRGQFLRKMWPIQLAFRFLIYFLFIFLCSLTLSNTSSFLTLSVQLIFSILLQHISKPSRYFWSVARSVQVSVFEIIISNQRSVCCVSSGRGLCDELITRPEESYRLWCVTVCDLETTKILVNDEEAKAH